MLRMIEDVLIQRTRARDASPTYGRLGRWQTLC